MQSLAQEIKAPDYRFNIELHCFCERSLMMSSELFNQAFVCTLLIM